MLAILFPHMYEDLEYLLPDVNGGSQSHSVDHSTSDGLFHDSAESIMAGPSRLAN